ncbi:MAG: glycosyltransferase [Lachnospiraceae bacterium]|nr:glycosyltransferase [Lachnospiraceae bacterium]
MVLPKISVIIPIYNAEKFLSRCLNSIIGQTWSNLEIILINDGSTDLSLSICREFEMMDDRIIVVSKENGGVSSSRNVGIERATGEYISFVDSDDYLDPNTYELCMGAVNDNNPDIIKFGFFNESSTRVLEFPMEIEGGVEHCNYSTVLYPKLCSYSGFNVVWNGVFRREIILGLYFDATIVSAEDFLFDVMAIVQSRNIYFISNPLYHYVQHDGQTIKKSSPADTIQKIVNIDYAYSFAEKVLSNDSYNDFFNSSIKWVNSIMLARLSIMASRNSYKDYANIIDNLLMKQGRYISNCIKPRYRSYHIYLYFRLKQVIKNFLKR